MQTQKMERRLSLSKLDPEEVRVADLRALIADLNGKVRDDSTITDNDFSKAFARAIKTLEMDDVAIARMIGISRPTIWRWQAGESAPFGLVRPAVFRSLRKEAMRKLRIHASAVEV